MGDLAIPPIIDYDEVAKRVWERSIPAVPVSGAFEEKFKQATIAYEIVRSRGVISLAAYTSGTVAIQPAAGETWLISIGQGILAYDGASYIYEYAGVTPHYLTINKGATGFRSSSHFSKATIDNTWYLELYAYNPDGVAHDWTYAYSGYKIKSSSLRIARFTVCERLEEEYELRKLSSDIGSIALPDYLEPLRDRAFTDLDGDTAILFEKDVPLRKDEKGNVIERLTAWFKVKDFERIFGDIIEDPAKRPIMHHIKERDADGRMGWLRYMKKFEEEGIEF